MAGMFGVPGRLGARVGWDAGLLDCSGCQAVRGRADWGAGLPGPIGERVDLEATVAGHAWFWVRAQWVETLRMAPKWVLRA
ncbi:hypothetical protein GCM10009533_27880 [Saccharopolyspora spinosporotrichia]|uniref:Uncharacterized protein n=1 Tax=Saccharopolyspora erythraea TaxID=1836 RepID=A0ABN1CV08_SACER